jgi:hypothetical protein
VIKLGFTISGHAIWTWASELSVVEATWSTAVRLLLLLLDIVEVVLVARVVALGALWSLSARRSFLLWLQV